MSYGQGFSKGPIPDTILYQNTDAAARYAANETLPLNIYSLYPVPSSNEFNLSFDEANKPASIEIADAVFNTIAVPKTITGSLATFDLSNLSPGLYYLAIQNKGIREIKKFTIVK